MAGSRIAPYGSWKSPITSDLIIAGTIRLSSVVLDGSDIYWTEQRPSERGRSVIVRRRGDGTVEDMTPPAYNVRSAVHEYGGGACAVRDGTIYFSNFSDGRLYRQRAGAEPEPITPEGRMRYADIVVDSGRSRLICVREDHTDSDIDAVNTLVGIDLEGKGEPEVLLSGNDFYSSPRISPDGSRLSWLTWNHPNMPWDGTEVWTGALGSDGSITETRFVAGALDESIFQPEWSPDGILHFVSDRTGWWNLYRLRDGSVEPICPMEAEFGKPQWVFGMSTYGFESSSRIICAFARGGEWSLGRLDTDTSRLKVIDQPYNDLGEIRVGGGNVVFIGGSPVEGATIVRIDLASEEMEVIHCASETTIDRSYLSIPETIEFPTENGLTAHAFFYPPYNPDFVAPAGELPPLLVKSHGGPTGSASATLNPSVQYWTSRGIGVLDVNYGGSTGYGTAYRRRLNGNWGIVDVDDCINGARYLVEQGRVDGNRLAISGGSAGGFTTLAALTFHDTFKAGASYYGVSDLEALELEGHKFEARYNHSLIGPYPERRDLYIERSPIHSTDRLSCPIILFQGLDDKVVPPNQSEMMFETLRRKGLPVAYVAFEGEQHGFRRAENIRRALEGEIYFYSKVFGFELADDVEPVKIENM